MMALFNKTLCAFALVLAGLSATGAASMGEDAPVIQTAYVESSRVDFMVTGGKIPKSQLGVMKYLDACDADCQAERLGLTFED